MLALVFYPSSNPVKIDQQLADVDADYFMVGVDMKQYDQQGILTNKLIAEKMEHLINDDTSVLTKPLIVFNHSSDSEWRLSSHTGKLMQGNQIIQLQQSVKMINFQKITTDLDLQQKTKIATESLAIDLRKRNASTEAVVTISDSNFRTKSTGLDINFEDQIIQLRSNVTTEFFQ
jgi:LPS export ABC transporter protein LptC